MTSLNVHAHAEPVRVGVIPIFLGVWAAAIVLVPMLEWKLILLAPGVAAAILSWILYRPSRWLYLLFFCLLALPPIPLQGAGNSGGHVAPLAGGIGVLIGLLRIRAWRNLRGRLPVALAGFLAVLLVSTGFAALYSGTEIAIGSLIRVLLFALGAYVFAYTLVAERAEAPDPLRFARYLYFLAMAAAIFACFDFYFQLPAPAGYGPQFVWLQQGVLRRAQGLFYEASTLGNFCAFFLTLVLVCLARPQEESPISRAELIAGGAVFAIAMILSYSRGSIVNILMSAIALIWLRKGSRRLKTGIRLTSPRAVAAFAGVGLVAAIAVQTLLPSFSANYWSRIMGSMQYIASSPNGVLSGRLTNWMFLGDFLWRQPWTAVFGIGYKTLPYSDYAGAAVVADNTYLQLLVETGVIGLAAFLLLNAAIIRTGLRAARSGSSGTRIFGDWIFCFWIGQTVQMLSGDLITYWRVLPVYFWVLAIAAKGAGRRR